MTPSSTYWLNLDDGRQFGPATIDVVADWCREGRVPRDAVLLPVDGGETIRVLDRPELVPILQAPPTVSTGLRRAAPTSESATALIPTGNPFALAGYYIAVFSMIPMLGIIAPVAIGLGIAGLRHVKANPSAKGTAHAWVAIILGTLVLLVNATIIVLMVTA